MEYLKVEHPHIFRLIELAYEKDSFLSKIANCQESQINLILISIYYGNAYFIFHFITVYIIESDIALKVAMITIDMTFA